MHNFPHYKLLSVLQPTLRRTTVTQRQIVNGTVRRSICSHWALLSVWTQQCECGACAGMLGASRKKQTPNKETVQLCHFFSTFYSAEFEQWRQTDTYADKSFDSFCWMSRHPCTYVKDCKCACLFRGKMQFYGIIHAVTVFPHLLPFYS